MKVFNPVIHKFSEGGQIPLRKFKNKKGKIHSFESFSVLDGPGIRYVIFFSGCPLRCSFCHNIDMVYPVRYLLSNGVKAHYGTYQEYSVSEVMEKIKRVQPYFKHSPSGGGITLSGGEPFFQFEFILELLKECKKIHTVIDTNLYVSPDKIEKIKKWVDLFLVGFKHIVPEKHKKLTGKDNKLILKNISLLNSLKKDFRIRYVVIPGISDNKEDVQKTANFFSDFKYLEGVELLPYHRLGVKKWKALNMSYKLPNVRPPLKQEIIQVKKIFQSFGISVL